MGIGEKVGLIFQTVADVIWADPSITPPPRTPPPAVVSRDLEGETREISIRPVIKPILQDQMLIKAERIHVNQRNPGHSAY